MSKKYKRASDLRPGDVIFIDGALGSFAAPILEIGLGFGDAPYVEVNFWNSHLGAYVSRRLPADDEIEFKP